MDEPKPKILSVLLVLGTKKLLNPLAKRFILESNANSIKLKIKLTECITIYIYSTHTTLDITTNTGTIFVLNINNLAAGDFSLQLGSYGNPGGVKLKSGL